jgi:hypothetical protein
MVYSTINKGKLHKLYVTLGNKTINETYSYKYLGLNFESNLKWNLHINMLLTKLKVLCKFAYYLSKVLDFSTKIIWYYSFVNCLLVNYAIILITSNKNLIDKVQSKQYKIIKSLFYREILKDLHIKVIKGTTHINIDYIIKFMLKHNIMDYVQIANYQFITFIAKQKVLYLDTKNKNRFNIGFKNNEKECFNRSELKLIMPYYKKTIGQLKLDFRAANAWNSIKVDSLISFLYYNKGSDMLSISKKYIKDYVSKITNFRF